MVVDQALGGGHELKTTTETLLHITKVCYVGRFSKFPQVSSKDRGAVSRACSGQ